jgi:2-iminobutanoate/2-iminopropanoate deaminase
VQSEKESIKTNHVGSSSILKTVKSKKAPEPIGPYSQATVSKNLVFVSGMIAIDPKTGKMVEGGVREQTERALASLKAVLKEAGASLEDVVKTTVFLRDASLFKDMNEVYGEFFGKHKPARATLVTGFPRDDILVEIEAIASRA